MTDSPTLSKLSDEDAAWQRKQAIAAFHRTWELIEAVDRTAAEDSEMLRAAFASRYLWDAVGEDEQRAIGDWQIAHVASLLGRASIAVGWAARALGIAQRNGWGDWRLASCYEGMARAYATAGDAGERNRYAALCREAIAEIVDLESRALIESQLATVPELAAK